MVNLSIREAVKHFDVSRPTLSKALKSGALSGVKDGKGQWSIDPAELARVYHPRSPAPAKDGHDEPDNLTGKNTSEVADLTRENERLAASLERAEARAVAAETLAEERAARIEDLRRMLPPPTPAPLPVARSWLSSLLRRGS